jgi:ribosome modulation factor
MQIPDTENIHFQHAFKKGYRMALEGKPSSSMPSLIRRDMEMRNYFQMGWEQAEEDITLSVEDGTQSDWRGRFAWGIMMLIGGISTTLLMLHNIKEEQAEQARLIAGVPEQTHHFSKTTPSQKTPSLVNGKIPSEIAEKHTLDLGLLSSAQRSDLEIYKAKNAQQKAEQNVPLQPIIDSDIKITKAILTSKIIEQQPGTEFNQTVPKYIRELHFYTQIEHANNQTLSHRWLFNNQILATIPLNIQSDHYRTWSSKKMSSAWQGTWHIEVLDANQDVIFRKTFIYGTQ